MYKTCLIMNGHPAAFENHVFDKRQKTKDDGRLYPFVVLKKVGEDDGLDFSTIDLLTPNTCSALLFSDFSKSYLSEVKDFWDQVPLKYLMIFESEVIVKDNWDIENHKFFKKIFTWSDDLVAENPDKYIKVNFSYDFPHAIPQQFHGKKLCCIIAGNKNNRHPLELYSKRVEAIRWFEIHHPNDFDLYGVGWDKYTRSYSFFERVVFKLKFGKVMSFLCKPNFPSYKGKVDSKNTTLRQYKFSICYENAKDISGYITEKIFDCFFAGCIPVYWGANNITDHIPKECFIDKRDFETYEELYSFMVQMTEPEYFNYIGAINKFLKSEHAEKFSVDYFAETIVKSIAKDLKTNEYPDLS